LSPGYKRTLSLLSVFLFCPNLNDNIVFNIIIYGKITNVEWL